MKKSSFVIRRSSFVLLALIAGCGDLEKGTLGDWKRASDKSRDRVMAAHFSDNAQYVKRCITRTAALANTEKMRILQVGELCETSLLARENAATKQKAPAKTSVASAKKQKKKK